MKAEPQGVRAENNSPASIPSLTPLSGPRLTNPSVLYEPCHVSVEGLVRLIESLRPRIASLRVDSRKSCQSDAMLDSCASGVLFQLKNVWNMQIAKADFMPSRTPKEPFEFSAEKKR